MNEYTGEIMRTTMAHSEQVEELIGPLVDAQGELGSVSRDSKADLGRGGAYRYATIAAVLDAVRAPLAARGLVLTQAVATTTAGVDIETRLWHRSGQWIGTTLTMQPRDASPQSIGSAITYGRRYGILTLLCLATEDDDGAAASQPAPAGRGAPAFTPPATPAPAATPAPDGQRVLQRLREVAAEHGATLLAEHDRPDIDREEARTVMRAIQNGTYTGLTAPKGV